MKKKNSVVLSTLGIIMCIVFGLMLLSNVIIIIKGTINPEKPPSVLGITPMVVQSGSMSGNAKDHIEVGDLIFISKTDADKLEVGDIISFMEEKLVITHRITAIETDEQGKRLFTTKGDANNVEDSFPVPEEQVLGIYRFRLAGVGDFAMFLQTPLGMILFMGIPLCLFVVTDVIRRRKSDKEDNKKTAELQAEIERLRKIAEEKQD
ncbi:MAG: signal peptidase I [Ruminococcus sp.]|nr:signal peptidase I [Ruminococcus sp.]